MSVSFVLDKYDTSLPLVIDPPLVWGTYYGGLNYDGPRTIYCDNANNNLYVVGYTASTQFASSERRRRSLLPGSTC